MSVACAVPEGASPPPEPPPRDYVERVPADDKIRARMEACKQGMMQLDAMRSKHNRLMHDMRNRLPPIPGCVVVQARIKRSTEPQDRSSKESVDSAISTNSQSSPSRCSSPSISHRSSVSCDSGCSSVYSTDLSPSGPSQQSLSYSAYRKLSVEERGLPVSRRDSHQSPLEPNPRTPLPIVATTIASTTSLEGVERHWRKKHGVPPRPRSMYERSTESFEKDSLIDSASFSQITPPPVHRKLGIAQQPPTIVQAIPRSPLAPVRFAVNASPKSGQRAVRTPQKPPPSDVIVKAKAARVKSPDAVFHASRVFMDRSPPSDRRTQVSAASRRPRSLFEPRTDEPVYATPARVLVRERMAPSFAQPITSHRTAFSPVVSRVISSYSAAPEKSSRGSSRVIEREWRESEGL